MQGGGEEGGKRGLSDMSDPRKERLEKGLGVDLIPRLEEFFEAFSCGQVALPHL